MKLENSKHKIYNIELHRFINKRGSECSAVYVKGKILFECPRCSESIMIESFIALTDEKERNHEKRGQINQD